MPNSVMKPIIDATLSTPPARNHAGHATDERERQVDHHERGVARVPEREGQQHEQSSDCADEKNGEPFVALCGSRIAPPYSTRYPAGIGTDFAIRRADVVHDAARSRPAMLDEITIRR